MLEQLAPCALVVLIWLATAILLRAWWAREDEAGLDDRLRDSMTRLAARRAAVAAAAQAEARRRASR